MTPKAKIKQEKKDLVTNLAREMKVARSVIFVDYLGLGVKVQQKLKINLKEVGGKMVVAKNTLIKLAGKKASICDEAFDNTILTGQTALIFGKDDPISPIQVLGKFSSENEILRFKGGIVEGKFYNESGLTKISKLPSKEVLFEQVLGTISAPLYELAGTLKENMQSLIYILEQIKERPQLDVI